MAEEIKVDTKKVARKAKGAGGERNLSVVPQDRISDQKSIIPNPEVMIIGDILYLDQKDKENGEINRIRVGRKLVLTQTNKALEDNTVSFDLEIYTKDGVVIEEGISRSILTNKEELFKTVEKGSDVNNINYKIYWKSLENQDEMIKNSAMSHKDLGWDIYEGEKIYKHEDIVSIKKINSKYKGNRNIQTKGSLEEYLAFIKDEIIGNVALEGAVAMGLSAVVVGFLDAAISHLFHLWGDSTTGKTTAGQVIISVASEPNLEKENLMMSWHSTGNAIVSKIKDLYGIPFLIDDSSVSKITDFSTIAYQLTMGRDKDRLNKESELRETSNWRTNIFSTGENSLLANSNENEGLKVRVSEFGNVKWTTDSAHADRIKEKTQKYHGHGVKIVAEELLKLPEENIELLLKHFEDHGRAYLKRINKINHLTDRKLKAYANVRLAIELFEKRVKLGFNMLGIEEFLLDNMFSDERAMWQIALDKLMSHVESNTRRFNRDVLYDLDPRPVKLNLEAKSYNGLLGKIEDIRIRTEKDKKTKQDIRIVEREVSILYDEFNKILKDLGFTNPSSILKSFKENDIIDCPDDRHFRKRKISEGGGVVNVIVIRSEAPYQEIDEVRNEYHRRNKRDEEIKDSRRDKKTKEETQEIQEEVNKMFNEKKEVTDKKEDQEDNPEEASSKGNLEEILANLELPDI